MDGASSAFWSEARSFSTLDPTDAGGILYIEDFDAPSAPLGEGETPVPPAEQPEPAFSADDIAAAHEAGRHEGHAAALADALLVQAQLTAAAQQGLADAVAMSRDLLERVALRAAEDTARSLLAVLRAAVPATMARHANCEVQAVLQALLPGLRCEPELRVRAHPDLADTIRESLIALLAADSVQLSVAADPLLAPGDLNVAWEGGQARRDTASIWHDIGTVLAPLGLPALEEICCAGS